jgi:hypothetical protein
MMAREKTEDRIHAVEPAARHRRHREDWRRSFQWPPDLSENHRREARNSFREVSEYALRGAGGCFTGIEGRLVKDGIGCQGPPI